MILSNQLKRIYLIIALSCSPLYCSILYAAEPVAKSLPLVPYPKEVTILEASFTPAKKLFLNHFEPIGKLPQTFSQDLTALGFTASQGRTNSGNNASNIEFVINKNLDLGQEGYQLKVGTSISITAATTDGLFWGTRTLLQLLHAGPGQEIPQLTITDLPEFEYRGLMVDNARKFHSIDFHIETIKRLAAHKLNRYQIHFSDHQSYTLPSVAFPDLPTKDRHYTKQEIAKLMEISRQYHVMIVPEIDVPGHAAALLKGIEGLNCGSGGGKLCIGREETYQALEKLFSEVMEMMPGAEWHLGADEVHYSGKGCEHCVARMKIEKLEDGNQLFNYFINRMHKVIQNNKRRMLVWEGFSPTLKPTVDKDIIVCPFDIKHGGKMPKDYFNAGYKVLNTSWTPLYVADKLYMTTPEIIARWSPYMFGAGRSPQPFAYWKKFNPKEYRGKVLGGQVCSWETEEKAEEGLLFGTGPGFPEYGRPAPRVQIMAERVWTGSSTTVKDLLERVGESYWE